MVQISDLFADTAFALVNSNSFFASSIRQAMETQEISIICLDDVFLGFVAKQSADISEVRSLSD